MSLQQVKSSRLSSWWRKHWMMACWGLGVLLVFCFMVFAVVASFVFGDPLNEAPRRQDMNDPAFRKLVERRTGITFPETVRWKGCHVDQWQETIIWIACSMPKRDVAKLVPGKELKWTSSERGISNNGRDRWFDPDSVKRFRYAELKQPKANASLGILYDDAPGDNELTRVYIMWSD